MAFDDFANVFSETKAAKDDAIMCFVSISRGRVNEDAVLSAGRRFAKLINEVGEIVMCALETVGENEELCGAG